MNSIQKIGLLSVVLLFNIIFIILTFTLNELQGENKTYIKIFSCISGIILTYVLLVDIMQYRNTKIYIEANPTYNHISDVVELAKLRALENNDNVKLYKSLLLKHKSTS